MHLHTRFHMQLTSCMHDTIPDTTIKDVSAPTKYNLVANLCHEGTFAKGAYKVHLQCRVCDRLPTASHV
jgi:ubiquitin C-terminal hydrolase